MNRTYKLGGLALVFLAAGLVLFLWASFFVADAGVKVALFCVGFLLIAVVWTYYLLSQVLPIWRARTAVRNQRRMIDAAQDASAVLADVAADLQDLAFSHATQVAEAVQFVRPKLRSIPFLGELADNPILINSEKLSLSIVQAGVKTKEALVGVRSALEGSDPDVLMEYTEKLRRVRGWLADATSSSALPPRS